MDQVSKPLLAVLVGTVLFFALWLVALRPGSSSSTGSGLGQYNAAISAAHKAVATSSQVASQPGNANPAAATTTAPTASTPAASPATHTARAGSHTTHTASTSAPAPRAAAPAGAQHRVDVVTHALLRHRVVAILFFNPAGADDRAVKQELASVPAAHGRVVKLAVPVGELTRYPVVTEQVAVSGSPTLVIIDARRQANSLVGYASGFELTQRISDALAVRPAA